jgi:serine phosphatase RsbU (regulator of sigma subunit)
MLHDIFPRTRSRTDFIVFGVAVLAVIVIASLRRYDVFPRPAVERLPVRDHVVDSVLRANNVLRDSVRRVVIPEYNKELIAYFSDSLGAYKARQFFDTANVYELVENISLHRREDDGIQISFGNGRRTRDESQDSLKIMLAVPYKHTLVFDAQGTLIGAKDRVRNLSLATLDTAQVLRVLQERFRVELQARGLMSRPDDSLQAAWKCDFSDPDKLLIKRVMKRYGGYEREFVLRAEKVRSNVYDLSWREDVRLWKPSHEKASSGWNIPDIVQTAFWVVFMAAAVVMLVLFVVRLRNRASNLPVAVVIAVAMGAWIAMSGSSVDSGFFELLLMWGVLLLFVGFLMYGMPTAGLLSLTRETFPEKFYTLQRLQLLRSKPREVLESMYLGRSILLGLSWGIIGGAVMYLRFAVYDALGWNSLLTPWIFNERTYALKIQVVGGFETWWAITFFFPILRMMEILALPTLAYKLLSARLPARLMFWCALVINCVGLTWYYFASHEVTTFAIANGLLMGIAGLLIVYYLDMLAIGIFCIVYVSAYCVGLADSFLSVQIACVLTFAALVVAGIVAYRREPEIVSEQEYKPVFMQEKEESERMHQELAAAKSVQQRLLPACLPAVERVEVCATCVPAFEVGGDYYDFFQLDERRLGVLIGDVSGKGISAAFYITLAKGVIVSQVRQHGSPAEVLHRVNALLYGVMERGKFVSMIYGIYDTHTREFVFANAGHNPVAVRRGGDDQHGRAELVYSRGMAIGLDRGARFDAAVQTQSIQLNTGDTIILYTDGVTEAMNGANEEYGDERLCVALGRQHTTADDLVSDVLSDVRSFVGKAHQHDDITMVALRAL